MKVILDAFGGDNSPQAEVQGAVEAVKENPEIKVVLVGDQNKLEAVLKDNNYSGENIEIVHASDVITCHDAPTEAVRRKTDSSLVVGLKKLKEDQEIGSFVSAGSTGAVLTGAVLKVGRIKGVSRPALAPIIPTVTGGNAVLVDCGANVDCKPVNLLHFAVMGSVYMKEVYGIENPRVGLLNNGAEEQKGCELTKTVYGLLKNTPSINFVGNLEGRDMLNGDYDVIVADGFYGNVALKTIEGSCQAVFKLLKEKIMASKKAQIGALLLKGVFKDLKGILDYNKKGGAIFIGASKVIIKSHGSSGAEAIKNSIFLAYNASKFNLNDKIKENIDNLQSIEL